MIPTQLLKLPLSQVRAQSTVWGHLYAVFKISLLWFSPFHSFLPVYFKTLWQPQIPDAFSSKTPPWPRENWEAPSKGSPGKHGEHLVKFPSFITIFPTVSANFGCPLMSSKNQGFYLLCCGGFSLYLFFT